MKISYFKTQWFSLLIGLVYLGFAIYDLVQGSEVAATWWFICATIWLIMSRVDYNYEYVTALEKKCEALEDKVNALQELLETERKYSGHYNKKLESLISVVEGKKK